MAKEWQTFVRKYSDLREGIVELFIKDLTPGARKYDTTHVLAEITKTKGKLPGADSILWVRGESGLRDPEPYYMKIMETLPEWVAGRPHGNVFDAIAVATACRVNQQ